MTVSFVPCSGDTWVNPFDMYRRLRDESPVHYVEEGDYWVLSRFADVFSAARDTETYSSAQGLTFTYGEREKIGLDVSPIVMMDPPEHTAFRRLVGRGFTPRQVSEIEPEVRAFVRARLRQLVDNGGGDIVAELFKPLPSFVVAHYLGVPEEDRARFDGWTDAIVASNAGGDVFSAADAVSDLLTYFTELIDLRRNQPGTDMTSQLIAAEEAGGPVDLLSILGFAFTMVTGGNDTTTGLLGGAAVLLAQHHDQRRWLIDEPARIGPAVEEFLRLTAPVQGLARTTTAPVLVHGQEIPQAKKVFLLYGSANRDEREFGGDADQCRVDRKIDKILSFSYGAHHCLGAAAARLQARVAIEELLCYLPDFEVDVAGARFAPGNFVRRYENLLVAPAE